MQTDKAVESARRARRKKWICFWIVGKLGLSSRKSCTRLTVPPSPYHCHSRCHSGRLLWYQEVNSLPSFSPHPSTLDIFVCSDLCPCTLADDRYDFIQSVSVSFFPGDTFFTALIHVSVSEDRRSVSD